MTLAERIAASRVVRGLPNVCFYCKEPYTGRYDTHSRSHDIPEWARKAVRGELPARIEGR